MVSISSCVILQAIFKAQSLVGKPRLETGSAEMGFCQLQPPSPGVPKTHFWSVFKLNSQFRNNSFFLMKKRFPLRANFDTTTLFFSQFQVHLSFYFTPPMPCLKLWKLLKTISSKYPNPIQDAIEKWISRLGHYFGIAICDGQSVNWTHCWHSLISEYRWCIAKPCSGKPRPPLWGWRPEPRRKTPRPTPSAR